MASSCDKVERQFEGKEKVIVYDYVDQALPMLQRMYKKRAKGYAAMGYTIIAKAEDLPK